jgi:hypothetical protein
VAGKETSFLRCHFILKAEHLPRQARDNKGKLTRKMGDVFSQNSTTRPRACRTAATSARRIHSATATHMSTMR